MPASAAPTALPAEPVKPDLPVLDVLTNGGAVSLGLPAGYYVCGFFLLCIAWALKVTVSETMFKRRMDAYCAEEALQRRRERGADAAMTEAELAEGERRLVTETADLDIFEQQTEDGTECVFRDYGAVLLVREQLEWGWRTGLTDPRLMERWSALYGAWRHSMERHYLFWESGSLGKAVLIGGALLSLFLCCKYPQLGIVIGIPLVLYSLAGRTPLFVAANPCWLDRLLNRLTGGSAAVAVAMLPFVLSFEETRYYRVDSGAFDHSEVTPTGLGPLLLAVIFAVASLMLVFVRIGLMFLRNYVIYRDMRTHHKALAWALTAAFLFLVWRGLAVYGCWELWFCEFGLVSLALLVWAGSAILQYVDGFKRTKGIVGPKPDLVGWSVFAALACALLLPITSLVREADVRDKYFAEVRRYKAAQQRVELEAQTTQKRAEQPKQQEVLETARRRPRNP